MQAWWLSAPRLASAPALHRLLGTLSCSPSSSSFPSSFSIRFSSAFVTLLQHCPLSLSLPSLGSSDLGVFPPMTLLLKRNRCYLRWDPQTGAIHKSVGCKSAKTRSLSINRDLSTLFSQQDLPSGDAALFLFDRAPVLQHASTLSSTGVTLEKDACTINVQPEGIPRRKSSHVLGA